MRAYFVVGPESSGNRHLVQWLVEGGCHGNGDINQPIDGPPPLYPVLLPLPPLPEFIAFYRSVPHGGTWPRIGPIIRQLMRLYPVTVIVTLRDQAIVERSQVTAGHVETLHEARANIRRAYRAIYSAISATGVEFVTVPYRCMGKLSYRKWLADYLELPEMPLLDFHDGDEWYQ